MAKKSWKEREGVEETICELLKEGPMTINMLTSKMDVNGKKAHYGLVKRRMEALQESGKVSTLKINHQSKFWKLE